MEPSSFPSRHPHITLIVGVVFYVLTIYGTYGGQIRAKPGRETLMFVMQCLPALAVYWSSRKALRLPVILAIPLASLGPVALAFVTF